MTADITLASFAASFAASVEAMIEAARKRYTLFIDRTDGYGTCRTYKDLARAQRRYAEAYEDDRTDALILCDFDQRRVVAYWRRPGTEPTPTECEILDGMGYQWGGA